MGRRADISDSQRSREACRMQDDAAGPPEGRAHALLRTLSALVEERAMSSGCRTTRSAGAHAASKLLLEERGGVAGQQVVVLPHGGERQVLREGEVVVADNRDHPEP